MRLRRLVALPTFALLASSAWSARASNVLEVPDNGSEQMARGGAWVARASDPLATAFNPAGLAGQDTRVTLQSNFIFHHTCFTRLKAANDTTFGSTDTLLDPTGHYPRVCNDIEPTFNPQLGLTFRVNDRLGLGALVIGPASAGEKNFPEFITDANGEKQAAPNRYLLTRSSGIVLFPTVGAGYEVIDGLRLGASLSWGFAKIKNAAATTALNTDNATSTNDVRANLQVGDYFIPRFSLGAIWSATPEIDVAGWYQWTDAVKASGDVGTAANYYTKQNAQGDESNVRYGDTIFPDCGTGRPADEGKCGSGDNAKVKLAWPMEAKLGFRYHKPRSRAEAAEAASRHKRDPLAQDVFDVEADFTWANNSAIDAIQIRFPGDATGRGTLPVAGVDGGEIPPNGDQIKRYNDVFGVRVGGDYNVVPDTLALRAGTFYETRANAAQYQHIDYAAGARFGLAAGATYRIRIGQGEKASALEIMVGYGHVFVEKLEREDARADGITALSGTSCNKSDPDPNASDRCLDGSERYRSKWPVNLGTITNAVNVINVGLAYRF
jgi:long-chain fatty acid transport protein